MEDGVSEEIIRAEEGEREHLVHLAKLFDAGELSFATPAGNLITVPEAIREVLARALHTLATEGAIAVVRVGKELTPRQAAEILGVSRPVVMQLLKKGVIPSRTVGTHYRIPLEHVLAYKRERDVERRRELDLLARESEEMGLH